MRLVKFIISLLLTAGLIHVLSTSFQVGKTSTPPMGAFLNPFTGFWQNAEPVVPVPFSDAQFDNLSDEVKVVYDDKMVPHIFAQSEVDAAFVQGYITAQHRLWQMEFQTHAAAGRLSEIVGATAIDYDKLTRRKGIPLGAKRTLAEWEKSPKFNLIQAYTDGINAYINQLAPKDYPLEYKLLGYAPEEWTNIKAVLLSKAMTNTLARFDNDIENTNTLKIFGKEVYDLLFPEYFEEQSPIIPKGTPWDFEAASVGEGKSNKEAIGLFDYDLEPQPDEGLGSNNWAVAGSKTASGNPILCGDPHLALTVPSIWYEIQIHTPEYNTYGVSLPGMPGVIIGFNENIAWSQTNVGRDVMDWYRLAWKDDNKDAYLYDGEYRKIDYLYEEIKVKGGESVYDTIKLTHYGPVVYESEEHPKQDLAMKWMMFDTPNSKEVEVFADLNKAKNYDDYVAAIAGFEAPAQNYVFASKDGDIALWCQGKYPLKRPQQGRFVLDGSTSEDEWLGFIPQAHNPHSKNPKRGFVSSANQHSTDPSYPYYYNGRFADYRGRRINNQLSEMENITPKDMMALQNDNYSLMAAESLPAMLTHLDSAKLTEGELEALKVFEGWEYVFEKESTAPTIFTTWHKEMYDLLWDEMLVYEDSIPVLAPEYWRTHKLLNDTPDSEWFDVKATKATETIADVMTQAFQKAIAKLKEDNPLGIPNWRNHKSTTVAHLARIGSFSVKNVDVGGHRYAPNAVSERNGPSWRMIVELDKEKGISAHVVYPGGQSGNMGSSNYSDFVGKWAAGEYYKALFLKSADEENERLRFTQTFSKEK